MMHMSRHRGPTAAALFMAGAAALSAGCGSTSSQSSARVRVADVATNAATANVLVNNASAYGDLLYESISPYLYVQTGTSTFSYTTTATIPSGITVPITPMLSLRDGQFYTIYLIGRSDVPGTRFLRVVAADDTHPTVAGQAEVRILNAAPDAGTVDVLVNGTVAFPGVSYPAAVTAAIPSPVPATGYQAIPAGTISVQANGAGTSAVVLSPSSVTLQAGKAYTLVLTEPTVTPTYGLDIVQD